MLFMIIYNYLKSNKLLGYKGAKWSLSKSKVFINILYDLTLIFMIVKFLTALSCKCGHIIELLS